MTVVLKLWVKDEQLLVEQSFWYSCDAYSQILTAELGQQQALSAYQSQSHLL